MPGCQRVALEAHWYVLSAFPTALQQNSRHVDDSRDMTQRSDAASGKRGFTLVELMIDQVVRQRGIARKERKQVAEQTVQVTTMRMADH